MAILKRPGKGGGKEIITDWPELPKAGEDALPSADEPVDGPPKKDAAAAPPTSDKPSSDDRDPEVSEQAPAQVDGAWSPDRLKRDDGSDALRELLSPVIRQTWLLAVIASLVSLGLVVWAFGQSNAVGFQGLLALDALLIFILGIGLYSYRLAFAGMLIVWTLLATLLVAALGDPLGQQQQIAWLTWRSVILLGFLRGASAVVRWNRLRPEGSGPIPWRLESGSCVLASARSGLSTKRWPIGRRWMRCRWGLPRPISIANSRPWLGKASVPTLPVAR